MISVFDTLQSASSITRTLTGNLTLMTPFLLPIQVPNISMYEEVSVTLSMNVVSVNRTIPNTNMTIPWRASYTYLNQTAGNPYTGTRGRLNDLICPAYLTHSVGEYL